ncbi:MAG: GPR endopeptidase [Lachnospiraceae bacterium]|nr:GPR endopeptidase [Lachnospiraceae bacterium]
MRDHIQTDLAIEERERFEKNVEIDGVVLKKKRVGNACNVTTMEITTDYGSKKMNKPKGCYVTLEYSNPFENAKNIADTLKDVLVEKLKTIVPKKIMVVGLGNDKATPDSLGPKVVEKISITDRVCCIVPGVCGRTGVESFNIVRGVCKEEKPDLILAVDSLAARNVSRITRTIQFTDTGIVPGSGVGNHRIGLNSDTIGIPVVALGAPTVINSVTIVHDTLNQLLDYLGNYEQMRNVTKTFEILTSKEKYDLIEDVMSGGVGKMYVTPKDIDEVIECLTYIFSTAINEACALDK